MVKYLDAQFERRKTTYHNDIRPRLVPSLVSQTLLLGQLCTLSSHGRKRQYSVRNLDRRNNRQADLQCRDGVCHESIETPDKQSGEEYSVGDRDGKGGGSVEERYGGDAGLGDGRLSGRALDQGGG